ncbi:hypothetical protein TWF696_005030 [Orbilia brochopaga]|uniref:Uncharacterized protein n=1 Tax=Orbilia brochopaga TaxID=3140254 RepID=A0AAV9V098_9PEZI
MVTELTAWHIQCIHPELKDEEEKGDYLKLLSLFLKKIWKPRTNTADSRPPMLEIDRVENCRTIACGKEVSAVKIRFRPPPLKDASDADSLLKFKTSVKYFCDRIFTLYKDRSILSTLASITTHSLMGLSPKSNWFQFYWNKAFFRMLLGQEKPAVLRDISHAGYFASWSKGFILL